MSDIPGEAEYELVMPFVVADDHGGPYDAESYAAGHEAGSILRLLWTVHPEVWVLKSTVRTANVPQLDLIAMHYGFVMATEVWGEDGYWSLATFTRGGDEGDADE